MPKSKSGKQSGDLTKISKPPRKTAEPLLKERGVSNLAAEKSPEPHEELDLSESQGISFVGQHNK